MFTITLQLIPTLAALAAFTVLTLSLMGHHEDRAAIFVVEVIVTAFVYFAFYGICVALGIG